MSWRSFSPVTFALLRRHAVLLVEWLQITNSLKRWRAECSGGVLLSLVAGVALAVGAATVLSSFFASAFDVLADYWVLTAAVTAVYAASSVARRRRRIHELHLQSWLIAAPIPQASVRGSQALRALLPMIGQFLAAALFILFVDWVADVRAAGKVIATVAGGLSVGVVVGWRASLEHSDARALASRYVPARRRQGLMQPSGQALSGWPIAQVLAWSRPENSRYVLIVALSAVQGGSSAVAGLSVVALYFVGSYLAALLSALLRVAKDASSWLRSTQMTLREFVWILSRRALLHQALGTTLVAAFMVLFGAPLLLALQLAAAWLGLVISISGCALVDSYRGRSPALKIALSVVAWAAVAAMLQLRASRA